MMTFSSNKRLEENTETRAWSGVKYAHNGSLHPPRGGRSVVNKYADDFPL